MNVWVIKARIARAHKSLTMWFNGVVASASGTLLLLPLDQIIAYMPQLQPYLTSEQFVLAMKVLMAINIINMLLRVKTTKALEAK